jgi:hypothetical protein
MVPVTAKAENLNITGDIPTLAVGFLIVTGHRCSQLEASAT